VRLKCHPDRLRQIPRSRLLRFRLAESEFASLVLERSGDGQRAIDDLYGVLSRTRLGSSQSEEAFLTVRGLGMSSHSRVVLRPYGEGANPTEDWPRGHDRGAPTQEEAWSRRARVCALMRTTSTSETVCGFSSPCGGMDRSYQTSSWCSSSSRGRGFTDITEWIAAMARSTHITTVRTGPRSGE
jgi:hypothetical protein